MKSNMTYLKQITDDIQSCNNDCFCYSFINEKGNFLLHGMSADELPSANTWNIKYTCLNKNEGLELARYVSYDNKLFKDYLKYKQEYYNFIKMEFVIYNNSYIFSQNRCYYNDGVESKATININDYIMKGKDCLVCRQWGGNPYLFLIIY